jgi:glycine cleavage system H protein
MSEPIPTTLKYTKEHEWAKLDAGLVVIGITHHAQEQLGDVVFLELPDVGRTLAAGKPFGVVESVKAVSDLYAPVDGEVVEVNAALVDTPEKVNSDPYGAAWMVKLRPAQPNALDALMSAHDYATLLAAEKK